MQNTNRPVGGAFLTTETNPQSLFSPEDFTAEDRLIGRTAEAFLRDEVLPQVERIERGDHALMAQLMHKAGALGLLGADVPEVYGGLELTQTTSALIAEKLNFQQSFALTHEAHTVIGTLPLLYFGNHDQKSRYLPKLASGEWIGSFALSEANSGSDALAMQARATLAPDGTHYILNGVKMWITNTAFAQLFTVFAKVDGQKVTAFLVEREFPGVSFGKEEHKLGMHGTSTRRVILDDVHVPVENALEVGKGHYAAFCALNMGRFKLEAGAVGGLKELLKICTAYASQRIAFGKTLADFGLVQHKLAEMAARIFALESMVYRLAGDLDGAFSGIVADAPDASSRYHQASEEYAVECNIVKVIGSESYSEMADEAIQIHGGYGYTEEFPLARAWRDQRLLRIGEGANEIVRLAIVSTLLRRDGQKRLTTQQAGRDVMALLQAMDETELTSYADPIDAIGATATSAKQLACFLYAYSVETLGPDLLEAQEIVASIADIVCAAYALESIALRCGKLREADHFRANVALLTGEVAARGLADRAFAAARYALDSLPINQDDDILLGLGTLLEGLDPWESNPMELRRKLATTVRQSEGYPL